jgi:hypothetical protein
MEDVAGNVKGGPAQVAQLYIDLIPSTIVYYKSDNIYTKKMKEQARTYFQANNLTQASATLEARIAAALGKGKK